MTTPCRGLDRKRSIFIESCGLCQVRDIERGLWTFASEQGRNSTGGDARRTLWWLRFILVTVWGGWALAVSDPPPFNVGKDPALRDI